MGTADICVAFTTYKTFFTYITSFSHHATPVRGINIVAVLQMRKQITQAKKKKNLNYNLNLSCLFQALPLHRAR